MQKWLWAVMVMTPAVLVAQMAPSAADVPPGVGHRPPERLPACQACHGVDGVATFPLAPNLAGQRAEYLVAQLKAFRTGNRKSDFMNPIAVQLSDREIGELAGHFSSLAAGGTLDTAARRAGAVATSVLMPAGFPSGFVEYAHTDDPDAGTITRSYANVAAVRAAGKHVALPDGAAIVVETRKAARDGHGTLMRDSTGRLLPGAVQGYSVSAAGAGWAEQVPATLRNGDWHYAQFAPDGRLLTTNQAACLACHRATESTSFVFGLPSIAAVAK